jgi:hypothetical protein
MKPFCLADAAKAAAQAMLRGQDNESLGGVKRAHTAHQANNFIRGKLGVPLN